MTKTILFVTYGGGHAHMVYPVVHALRESASYKNGSIKIQVLGLPSAKSILHKNGVECFGFADYLDTAIDADALEWGTELAKTHHSPTIGIELAESIAYLGLNYKDMVTRLGKEQAGKAFKEKGRNAFYPLTIMERIFNAVQPAFIVTSNSPRSEAAAIEIANKRGIHSLSMTDLFTGMGGYELKAKNVTFINEFAMRKFRADGCVAKEGCHYYYTGNPAFDKILDVPREKDSEWLRLHFPEAAVTNKKLVLHADMPAYWHTKKNYSHFKNDAEILEEMEACYRAAMQNDAVYLIRPHPSQGRELFQNWLKDRPNAYLAADCDLQQLLRNVDLVVVRSTTVGLEAAYMQKRVLQLDCSLHTDLPLIELGIAWGVDGYATLAGEMEKALNDDTRFEEIKKKMLEVLPHAPAAASIAGIILKLIES